jgi:hypothetical protein
VARTRRRAARSARRGSQAKVGVPASQANPDDSANRAKLRNRAKLGVPANRAKLRKQAKLDSLVNQDDRVSPDNLANPVSKDVPGSLAKPVSRTALFARPDNPAVLARKDSRDNPAKRVVPGRSRSRDHQRSRSLRSRQTTRRVSARSSLKHRSRSAAELESLGRYHLQRGLFSRCRLHYRQINEARRRAAIEYLYSRLFVVAGLCEKDVVDIGLRISVIQRKPA